MIPSMSGIHQRRSARVPIEIKVEYKRINAFIADFTRDISGGGLFIRTDQPLPEGTEALFTLSIPRLETPVTLRGAVRRVVSRGDPEGDAGMGIELLFQDDQERIALKQVVDALMVEHLGEALFRRLVESSKASDAG
jgi:type IV pilus assembly protein PilZ